MSCARTEPSPVPLASRNAVAVPIDRCNQCGALLPPPAPEAPHTKFCATDCRKLWHAINSKRGRQLLMLTMEARYNRHGKGRRKPRGPGDINSLIAYWRRQDIEADRVSWDPALVPVVPRRVL